MLETLSRNGSPKTTAPETPSAVAEDLGAEAVSFIEVGGKQGPVEGSPDVLAAPCRPPVAPIAPAPVAAEDPRPAAPREAVAPGVWFRPIAAAPSPAMNRFAAELVTFHRPDHVLSKQYQSLASSLVAQLPATRSRVVLFTAARPGAGTTTVLLNVGIALARQGKQRVVVVDANPNQPAVAERLGLPEVPGLGDLLAGGASLADVLQETGQANLLALTAGREGRLHGEAVRSLLRQLRERFELVLLDGPCWSAAAGLLPLALLCDGVYVVSPESEAQDAETATLLQGMTQHGVPLRGHLVTAF
jgi:Mrp family chromosome partitioning ATPase